MKILITGGAGFIGSYLCERLLKQGHTIFVLDNLSTGRRENLTALGLNRRLVFKKGSVLNQSDLRPLVAKCDQIYHLAAAVGVKLVVEKPLESFIINTEGTRNILVLAAPRKIPVLITSSSEVYGKNTHLPFKEDDDRVYGSVYNERWGYALSKTADEFLGLAYWRERGLPVVVVRLFNTVGPRQTGRYGMVIPRLVDQALRQQPLTVYGNGKQIRSFGYVEDVVDGMIKLFNFKKAYGEIFNLGSPEPVTINALAKLVRRMTKSVSPIVHVPYEKAYNKNFEDMLVRVPDITKAKRFIGYHPSHSLKDILQKVIVYYATPERFSKI